MVIDQSKNYELRLFPAFIFHYPQYSKRYIWGNKVFALVAVSGGMIMKDCVGMSGMRVLNLHGSKDETAPIGGGYGKGNPAILQANIADAGASLQAQGATWSLQVVSGAAHVLPSIDSKLKSTTGKDLVDTLIDFIFPSP